LGLRQIFLVEGNKKKLDILLDGFKVWVDLIKNGKSMAQFEKKADPSFSKYL